MSLSADTRRRIVGHLAALASDEDAVAQTAEYRLIHFGSKAVDALLQAATDPNPKVRFRAVWALGKIGDARAFDTILARTDDPDEAVWYDATLALGELQDPRAIPYLARMMYRREDEQIRSGVAAMALMKFGPAVIPCLKEMLEKGSPETRQLAQSCLEDYEETDALAKTVEKKSRRRCRSPGDTKSEPTCVGMRDEGVAGQTQQVRIATSGDGPGSIEHGR
jgi:HEAT repeat protein